MNPQNITGFEWDSGNDTKSYSKHGIEIYETEEVFFNRPLIVGEDGKHSEHESRHFALGKTHSEKLLFIAFTVRNNRIRVISARPMHRKERMIYHEKSAQSDS